MLLLFLALVVFIASENDPFAIYIVIVALVPFGYLLIALLLINYAIKKEDEKLNVVIYVLYAIFIGSPVFGGLAMLLFSLINGL